MNVLELKQEIAVNLDDPAMKRISDGLYLLQINKAARDLRNSGWYIDLEEDETITEVASTYTFPVPASFAVISELRRGEAYDSTTVYDTPIPSHFWELGLDGGVPIIRFDSNFYSSIVGSSIKVIGQRRPTIYTDDADTIDTGCESFLSERALSYGARLQGLGGSELARSYAQIAEQALRNSLIALSMQPQSFRINVNGWRVPGR